jgi:hypothetical protein
MSDAWIKGSERLRKAVGETESKKILLAMRRGQVEKRLHKIDPTGKLFENIIL